MLQNPATARKILQRIQKQKGTLLSIAGCGMQEVVEVGNEGGALSLRCTGLFFRVYGVLQGFQYQDFKTASRQLFLEALSAAAGFGPPISM